MVIQKTFSDAMSEASTTGYTAATPATEDATVCDDLWDGRCYAVPWPGSSFIIIERNTDKAITLTSAGLRLEQLKEDGDANNRWLCVERNGYFAFYSTRSRVYMGHDGKQGMRASARVLDEWEFMSPRKHPEGGYQLLVPFFSHTVMMVTADGDGRRLKRTRHGTTTWDFVKV